MKFLNDLLFPEKFKKGLLNKVYFLIDEKKILCIFTIYYIKGEVSKKVFFRE